VCAHTDSSTHIGSYLELSSIIYGTRSREASHTHTSQKPQLLPQTKPRLDSRFRLLFWCQAPNQRKKLSHPCSLRVCASVLSHNICTRALVHNPAVNSKPAPTRPNTCINATSHSTLNQGRLLPKNLNLIAVFSPFMKTKAAQQRRSQTTLAARVCSAETTI
jgi:hypothetical protein